MKPLKNRSHGVPFDQRLQRCLVEGRMTISDLARWFDRPRPTVQTWVVDGCVPIVPYRQEILYRLGLLEKTIEQRRGQLIPHDTSQRKRAGMLKDFFYVVYSPRGFSQNDIADARVLRHLASRYKEARVERNRRARLRGNSK